MTVVVFFGVARDQREREESKAGCFAMCVPLSFHDGSFVHLMVLHNPSVNFYMFTTSREYFALATMHGMS